MLLEMEFFAARGICSCLPTVKPSGSLSFVFCLLSSVFFVLVNYMYSLRSMLIDVCMYVLSRGIPTPTYLDVLYPL